MVPGLIDNHNHFVRGAQHWSHLVRLEGVTSKGAALERLRSVADRLTGDQWLIALGGWNEEQFTDAEPRFTLAELDAIAGGRPAFLQAQYDHAFVNSAFLEHFGIDPAAPQGVTGAWTPNSTPKRSRNRARRQGPGPLLSPALSSRTWSGVRTVLQPGICQGACVWCLRSRAPCRP